jgi:hypothetical protein
LGYSRAQATDYKVKEFCKLISEFALEYKTVRDRLLQQQEKRANHRERGKTRGKLITEVIFSNYKHGISIHFFIKILILRRDALESSWLRMIWILL